MSSLTSSVLDFEKRTGILAVRVRLTGGEVRFGVRICDKAVEKGDSAGVGRENQSHEVGRRQ